MRKPERESIMNKKDRILHLFPPIALAVLFALLAGAVVFPRPPKQERRRDVQIISDWDREGESLCLPCGIRGLDARSRITLCTTIFPKAGDHLYLKSVYTAVKVYADGELIYQYGGPGSYPAFLLDPPTRVALFPLPENGGGKVTLQMEYLAPSQRNTAMLHPPLMGSSGDLYAHLFSEMGFSLFFSIVLIALGMILCLIAFVLTRFEKSGIAFFWLGLFSLCTGIWVLGECNLTGLFIPNPSLLYVMAFLGLFSLAIPMMKFGLVVLRLSPSHPLHHMCLTMELVLGLTVLLQLSGIVSLSKSMYLFHVLTPLAFCLFAGSIIREIVRNQNPLARKFFLPVAIIALFSFLEVGNYYLFHLEVQKSFFFQIGVLLFLLIMSALCGYFIRDTFALRSRNRQLSYELSLMEKQVEVQRQRHQLLSAATAQIRQQRHDLKHHFAVIRSYLNNREDTKLSLYLDRLCANIPDEPFQTLCENEAVNAVALHYLSMATKAGVSSCHIRLDIPGDTGRIAESDLCVIIGNLLENAVDSCRTVEDPFIRMQSRLARGILTITMDNSCPIANAAPCKAFPSTKPSGGTGLASIRSVAGKYQGGCRFEVRDHVFLSSVYLHWSE